MGWVPEMAASGGKVVFERHARNRQTGRIADLEAVKATQSLPWRRFSRLLYGATEKWEFSARSEIGAPQTTKLGTQITGKFVSAAAKHARKQPTDSLPMAV